MSDDPTGVQPMPPFERDDGTRERRLLFALLVAYLCAGGVLAFALLELEAVADQINSTPFCRRI